MIELITRLEGFKTYIMAAAYGVDAIGTQLGWWSESTVRTTVEQVLTFMFLRAGVSASGPAPVK